MKNKYKTKKQLIEELEALQKQVDKLKKTETRAKQAGKPSLAAQYWQTMFDAINDAVSIIDRNGKITQCNKTMASLLQKPTSEIIGHKCWELLHGSTKPIPECPIVRMKKSLKRETLTLPLIGRWFEVTADPIIDKRGKLAGAVHIIADITKSKRIEEILEKERQELKLIIDSSPIIVFYKDKEGKFIRVNKTFAEAIKMPEEEFVGKTVFDLYSAKIAQGMTNDEQEVLKSGRPKFNIIEQYESASGIRWVQTDKIPICDKNGIPVRLIGFAQDITECKIAEKRLQRSEEYFRALIENSSDVIIIVDKKGTITYTSPSIERILGYKPKELIGKSGFHFILPADLPRAIYDFGKAIITKEVNIPNAFRVRHKDGSERILEGVGRNLFDNPAVEGFIMNARDVSERKQTEDKLRKSEEKYSTLFDGIFHGIIVADIETGQYIEVNPAACKALGYSEEEIKAVSQFKGIHPKEETERIKRLFYAQAKGEIALAEDIPFVHKNGTIRYFDVGSVIMEVEGVRRVVGLLRDITERKQAEEVLRKSEERYRDLYDNAPDMYHTLDKNGIIVNCNETEAKMLGYKKEEIIGRPITDFFSEESKRLFEINFSRLHKENKLLNLEREFIRKDGTTFPAILNVFSEYDEKGKFVGTKTIARDVTERKKTEETLRQSEERYRKQVEEAIDAIFLADLGTGMIVDCNIAASKLVEREKSEIIGKHQSFLHPAGDIKDGFSKTFKSHMTGESSDLLEDRVITKSGQIKDVTIRASKITIEGKEVMQGIFRDITDRKRMEEELKSSHEIKIFGQLAAGVAHEVRNPLNAILAITEALFQDIGDNPEYLPYLEHIRNQVNRLSILMKDLLEIGKPISQDSFQPETVAGIVTSTIDLWGTIEMSKGHALRFISQSESEEKYLKTDITRFQQVILNLLQNAAQNSPEGSEIVIQVLEPRDKTVNIHIIDRGTGIPHDNLLYVFEPFFTTQKGGTGLGLSIVKHFVESMGGKVAIWNNDPPPGCTVELRLPIATDSES